jgi:hypothetical protein
LVDDILTGRLDHWRGGGKRGLQWGMVQ